MMWLKMKIEFTGQADLLTFNNKLDGITGAW